MAMLLSLLATLVGFGISWAALRFVAQLLGAGRTSWGACFLAMFVPQLFGLAVAFGMALSGLPPEFAIVVAIAVQIWLVARFLEAGFLLALAISLLSALFSGVVIVGLYLGLVFILGAGFLAVMGLDAVMNQPAPATGGGIDGGEQNYRIRIDSSGRMTTSDNLVIDGDSVRRADDGSLIGEFRDGRLVPAEESETASRSAQPAREPIVRPDYDYKQVSKDALHLYARSTVRLHLEDGREMEGVLTRVENGTLYLERRLSGGTLSFTVEESNIRKAEAWTQVN